MLDTYQSRMQANQDPDSIDKEFLRRWYQDNCDPYTTPNHELPTPPQHLITELARRQVIIIINSNIIIVSLTIRYIITFEILTGETFEYINNKEESDDASIQQALQEYYNSSSK